MTQMLRIGYVVFARTEARLASATLASIARQERRADEVILVVPSERRHAFEPPVLYTPEGVLLSRLAWDHADNERAAALRSVASRVDVAVFLAEGLILQPDHCAKVAADFTAWADLTARLEISDKCLPVETRATLSDLPAVVENSRLRRAYRRLLRPRLLMQSALAIRTRTARGMEFERLSEHCDWLAYSLLVHALARRGGVATTFSNDIYEVRPQPDHRWRYETSYEVYRTLFRLSAGPGPRVIDTRLELLRFMVDIIEEWLILRQKRWPVGLVLKGMLAARSDARATRRSISRDIKEIGFG